MQELKEARSGSTNERNHIIDLAKFIAGLMVVFGHILLLIVPKTDPLLICITSSHMPLFFAISGYFFYSESHFCQERRLLAKKAVRLLIPYGIWSTVSMIIHTMTTIVQEKMYMGGHILSYLLQEGFEIYFCARSVWFLLVLFLSQAMLLLLLWLTKKLQCPLFPVAGCVYIAGVLLFPNKLFSLYKFKWLFPFLLAGYYFRKYEEKLVDCKRAFFKIGWISWIAFPLYVFTVLESSEGPFSTISIQNIGSHIVVACFKYVSAGVLGMLAVYYVAYCLSHIEFGRKMAVCGQYTLDVYVIQMPFVSVAGAVISKLFSNNSVYILYFAAIVFGSCIVAGIILASRYLLRKNRFYRFSVGIKCQVN